MLLAVAQSAAFAQATATLERPKSAQIRSAANEALPEFTAIDEYVRKPDASYRWKVVKSETVGDMQLVVIDMVSQTWRTPEEVESHGMATLAHLCRTEKPAF